jgi:hypothetical protein
MEPKNQAELVLPEMAKVVDGKPQFILWDKEVIKSDQNVIKANLSDIDRRIHNNLIQCYLHTQKHGDTSLTRRLLVEVLQAADKLPAHGYRVKGIIFHMREYTPMELVKDVIKLSGTLDGQPRPWRIEEAMANPFWTLAKAAEQVDALKPVFKGGIVAKLEAARREYTRAIDNTKIVDGKVVGPIVPGKPFYDGIHLDKMDTAFDQIEGVLQTLNSFSDATQDARKAEADLKRATAQVEAANAQ